MHMGYSAFFQNKIPGMTDAEVYRHELSMADLAEPLMSVTLIMPGDEYPLIDPYDIRETLEHDVDLDGRTVADRLGDDVAHRLEPRDHVGAVG